MRKRTALLVTLGLAACLCWAFGTAIAEQPVGGAVAKTPSLTEQPAAKAATKVSVGAEKGLQTNQVPGSPQTSSGVRLQEAPAGTTPEIRVPAGYEPRAISRLAADPSKLIPIPQGVERQRGFVPAITEGAGPRDDRGDCVPEGGDCGPIVYKNLEQEYFAYYTNGIGDIAIGDDVWLAGTERAICQIIVASYGGDGTYSYTLEIWTDCPAEPGAVRLYGPINSGTRPAGYEELAFTIPGVEVPTYLWISTVYTGVTATSAGPIIGEAAEIGFNDDFFGVIEGTPPACAYYWYGGGPVTNPWAGLAYQISAAGDEIGKCCYNSCAACVDTTYGDCMALGGNPEFLLGAACADVPGCAKGACCLDTGACVDDKTLAECQALTGYIAGTWTLGAACNPAPGSPYLQKYCALPPDNDDCEDAELLTGTCVTAVFNSAGATLDVLGSPTYWTVSCLEGETPGQTDDDVSVAKNIWYKWRVPSTYDGLNVTLGQVVISTLGSKYDTVLAVYATRDNSDDCGTGNAITCNDVTLVNEVECSDDIVSPGYAEHGHIQHSYAMIEVSYEGGSVRPGACLLIMVSGLDQAGNPPGGPGQLNIDFIPIEGDGPWNTTMGVCCLPTDCIMATSGACDTAGGYHRPLTDFYEGVAAPPAPFEAKAGGCCHGDFGSCQEGEYCAKAIDLGVTPYGTLNWAGDVHRVTYFEFVPRDLIGGESSYAITIDTCGSAFDTVVSVYEKTVDEAGNCVTLIARNDDCTLSTTGAEGRVDCTGVTTKSSCLCIGVGAGELLLEGETYYIGVGMKDARGLRDEGIDPVPNYPIANPAQLKLKVIDVWEDCLACDKACCKADTDGNGVIDGRDIQPFVNIICGTPPPCRVDDPQDPYYKAWCRANMNGDAVVDLDDIPLFVNALLVPWDCDFADYCEVEGYGQFPDYPTGSGGIISDMKVGTKIADNFISFVGGQITRVCWWGVYKFRSGSTWQACTYVPDDDFTITFYSSVDNRPGDVLAQYSNIKLTGGDYTLSRTATGRNVVDVPEYKYEVTGLPPVAIPAGECVWIEILNNTSAGDCWWLWELQGNSGDAYCGIWEYGYYRYLTDTDVAFSVNIPIHDGGCARSCFVPCPQGATDEGEPDCYEGFVDTTNGGCYLQSPLFTPIANGETICGTTGIFPSVTPGYVTRDSDWYSFTIASSQVLKAQLTMDFRLLYFIIDGTGGCADWIDNIVEGWGITPCATGVEITTKLLSPGTYYLLIIPDFDYTFDQPCGSKYTLKASWEPVAVGACCSGASCVGTLTEAECCALNPNYTWYKGETCPGFSCPTAGVTMLWDNYTCTSGVAPIGATGSQYAANYPFRAQVADDFQFAAASTVKRARWVGSYYNGTGTMTAFKVLIYNNAVDRPTGAGQPDPSVTAIYNQSIPIANVLQIDNGDGTTTYEAALPVNFSAAASTRYWIAFEAQLDFPPQWGVSTAALPIQGFQARTGFPALGTQFWNGALTGQADMAFKLYGTAP